MSRIRSQLEAIRRNSDQQSGDRGHADPAPRPVYRAAAPQEGYRSPASAPSAELDRIRQQLDQLTGAIGGLARTQQQRPPEPPRQPMPAPADDRNAAAALARIELLQREMADVKHMLTQMSGRDAGNELAQEMRRVAEGIARLQQQPQAAQFDPAPHLDEVASELHQIRQAVIALADERQSFDPSTIGRSIEEGYSRIASHLDMALERNARQEGNIELAAIASQIGQLRDLVEGLPRQMPIDSLSARLEEIAQSVIRMDTDNSLSRNFRTMEERLDEITRALVALSVNPAPSSGEGLERVEARLSVLARSLEELSARTSAAPADGGYASPVLDHIMMQLGDLSSRIDGALPAGGLDPAQWSDPIMARLDELGSRMENMRTAPGDADQSRFRSVEEQIAAIAWHIEQSEPQQMQAVQPVSDERLAALEDALGAIASRLNTVSSDGIDLAPIAGRLDSIEQMLSGARNFAMDAASSAAERAIQMAGAAGEPAGGDMLGLLAERLEGIEQQLALSRDMAMDAAAQAAERAIQMAGQIQPTSANAVEADGQAIEQLSRELQNLDAQARDLASRSDDSFEGIRQALQSISHRLEGIEDEIRRATSAPEEIDAPPLAPYEMPQPVSAARHAPQEVRLEHAPVAEAALWENEVPGMETPVPQVNPVRHEAELEDIPLEPGSGVPDLAALVRDASKRRKSASEDGEGAVGAQDFLAAARRAAQAAVAQESSANANAAGASEKAKRRFALPSFLQDKRKLLMGASAIILIAAAIPVVSGLRGGEPPAQVEARLEEQVEHETEPAIERAGEAQTANTAQSGQFTPDAAQTAAPDTDSGQPAVRPVDPNEIAAQPGNGPTGGSAPGMEADAGMEIPAAPQEIGNAALRQAAEAGDPLALFEIARRYTEGEGVERNLETAAQWYEIAARAGSAPAQYRLANFLEKGHGVKLDVEKSAMWYQRAAEQGNALAMHNLAVIYTSGLIGGKPDMESAIGWFQKAADLGVKDSQVNLGIIFAKGIGIEADAEQAYKWLAVAARGGDTDAAGKRDTLASAMRPEQLEKARGAAELWKPQPLDPQANVSEQKPEWKSGSGANAMLPGSALEQDTASVTREMIARVQEQLARMGYDPGPADGQMGTRTVDAVKAFQKKAGLPVDGQITTELLEKLDQPA